MALGCDVPQLCQLLGFLTSLTAFHHCLTCTLIGDTTVCVNRRLRIVVEIQLILDELLQFQGLVLLVRLFLY